MYKVHDILGICIGSFHTVQDTVAAILKQLPLSAGSTAKLSRRLQNHTPSGAEFYVEYNTASVLVIKD